MQLVEILCQDSEKPLPTPNDKIAYARPQIFDFSYPFYDSSKTEQFETAFIKHFYTRSLGFETPGMWKFKLEETLNLIMPYYNQLFESTLMQYEPLQNFLINETYNRTLNTTNTATHDLTDTGTRETTISGTSGGTETAKKTGTEKQDGSGSNDNTETQTGTIQTDSNKSDVYSDTPQAMLSNLDYATNARKITEGSTQTNNLTNTNNGNTTNTNTTTFDTSVNTTRSDTEKRTENRKDNLTRKANDGVTENAIDHWTKENKGLTGNWTSQDLILKYRQTFINVTKEIFDSIDVQSLFIFIF